jgi:hypothetical protein
MHSAYSAISSNRVEGVHLELCLIKVLGSTHWDRGVGIASYTSRSNKMAEPTQLTA